VLQSDDSVLQQVNQSLHRSFLESCQNARAFGTHTFGTSPPLRRELSESSSIGSNLSLAYLWSPSQEPFERCGLGVVLHCSDRDMPAIAAILPGGPANEFNDIKLLDRIISIDGIDTFGKQMEHLCQLFLGRANTNVSLVIRSVSGEKKSVSVKRRALNLERSRDLCTPEFAEHTGAHTQQHWQIGFDSDKHLDPEAEIDSFNRGAVLSHLCRWLRNRLQKVMMSSIIQSWAYYVKSNMKNARMLANAVNRNNLTRMMLSFDTIHDHVHSNVAKVDKNVVRTVLLNRKSSQPRKDYSSAAYSTDVAAETDDEKTGIGIVFGRSVVGRDPYTIQKVLTDGTAYHSGMIKAGDWLHEVNGVKVIDLTVDQIKSLILGKPCSPITVTISFFERGLAAPRLPPAISRGARENDRPWIAGALVDTGDDRSNMNGAGKSVDRVGATNPIPSDQQYSIASTPSASSTKEQQESRCPTYPLDRQSPELTCLWPFQNLKPTPTPDAAAHGVSDRTLTQEEISFQHDHEKKINGFHENKTPCVKTQFPQKKRTTPETDVSIAVTEPRRLSTVPGKVTAVAAYDEFNTGTCPRRNLWGGHRSPQAL